MRVRRSLSALLIGLLAALAWGAAPIVHAQEGAAGSGSEHSTEHPKEHPAEHPTAEAEPKAPAKVSMEELSRAIEHYVEGDSNLKGGYFLVYDTVGKKPLALKLDKVHQDKLARVHEGTYFACADFKTSEGTVYDLDIFLKGGNANHLKTTEVTVHKKDGKPRYNWKEEGGAWSKVPTE